MLYCPASNQSGTGMKITNDAGTDPMKPMKSSIFSVQYRTEIMNADISLLDADAQLRLMTKYNIHKINEMNRLLVRS
jgi:hypothetical protein